MFVLQHALLSLACLLADAPNSGTEGSYLYFPATGLDGKPGARVERYVPHEGDIVLYNDHKLMWQILYRIALTEPPDHSGIVILRTDGTPALLESGPDDGEYVCIIDAGKRLRDSRARFGFAVAKSR